MDRKIMCIIICLMIGMGAALNIVGQALDQELKVKQIKDPKPAAGSKDDKEQRELMRGSMWCINLSYLMGAVALLLIMCCLCCRDVSFGKSGKDDYD